MAADCQTRRCWCGPDHVCRALLTLRVRAATCRIGKGTAGVMKRHGMKGGNASHGTTKTYRKMGATGGGQDPGRVWPGKKMAGRMGNKRVLTLSLQVHKIDTRWNVIYVKGCVSGAPGVRAPLAPFRRPCVGRGAWLLHSALCVRACGDRGGGRGHVSSTKYLA